MSIVQTYIHKHSHNPCTSACTVINELFLSRAFLGWIVSGDV